MTTSDRQYEMRLIASSRQRGMTLVELLLATAGVSLVTLAISSMMTAVAYGTSNSRDLRSLVVRQKSLSARINAAIRGSRAVLFSGNNQLLLWIHDDNEDAKPNVGEMRLLAWNSNAHELYSYKAKWSAMTTAQINNANVAYSLSFDFQAVATFLKTQTYFPAELWGTRIINWSISLDKTSVQHAKLVSYQVGFEVGKLSDTMIGTAALRNE